MGTPGADYYYLSGTEGTVGPVSAAEIVRLRSKNAIFDATLVRKGSEGGWLPVAEYPELQEKPAASVSSSAVTGEEGASVEGIHKPKARRATTVFLILFIGLFGWGGLLPFISETSMGTSEISLSLFCGVIVLSLVAVIWNVWVSSVAISAEGFKVTNLFGVKELRFDEISGFRLLQSKATYLIFVAKDQKKDVKIDNGYADFAMIVAWARRRFVDLNVAEAVEVTKHILNDPALDGTPESRAARLALAKKVVKWITFLVMAVSLWGAIWPHPYRLAILCMALAALLPLSLLWFFRGYVVFDGTSADPRPKVSIALFPLLVMNVRAVCDFTPFAVWWHLVVPCLAGGVVLAFLLSLQPANSKRAFSFLLGAAFFSFCFYGPFMESNCLLDSSLPRRDQVTVLSGRIYHGSKGGTYYNVSVSPWPGCLQGKEFNVSRAFYDVLHRSERLVVVTHAGLWHIPWGELERPAKSDSDFSWDRPGELLSAPGKRLVPNLALLRKSAESGDVNAQAMLGDIYFWGTGVAKDYARAAAFYKMAAEQGNVRAQASLGCLYFYGNGVSQDYTQALQWNRKAAAAGNATAQQNLGWSYEKGLGVPANPVIAYAIYRVEAMGNAPGNQGLRSTQDLKATLSPEEVKRGEDLALQMEQPGEFLPALDTFPNTGR